MVWLFFVFLSLAEAQDENEDLGTTFTNHYVPKLHQWPKNTDPEIVLTKRVKIDVVPMGGDCSELKKVAFCSERPLDELQATAKVVCKSAEGMWSGGEAVELENVNKPNGLDFDCTMNGNENSLDQCKVIELDRCKHQVIVECNKMTDTVEDSGPDLHVLGVCESECGCMARTLHTNIIGGTDAGMGEFPWQVTITDGQYICGGSIIDSWHVLTAAHCMHSPSASKNPCEATEGHGQTKICSWLLDGIRIYYDTIEFYNIPTASNKVTHASEIYIHHEYVRGKYVLRHDIAVIRLVEELSFNNYVGPVCLPDTKPWDRSETDWVIASGFGTTSPDRNAFPDTLQKVDLQYIPLDTCNDRMYNLLKDEHLCAGDETGDRDSCRGDSGGPLTVKDGDDISTQIGIVSFSYGCAQEGLYSIYTDVTKEIGFIRSVMNGTPDDRTVVLTCVVTEDGNSCESG